MSKAQKIIKYIAIAFAFFLIFSIISGITSCLFIIGDIFGDEDNYEVLKDLETKADAKVLDIDIASSSMIIKTGDVFKVETSSKYIESKQDNDKISITEKKHNFFHNTDSTLVIYVPKDLVLDGVSISNGAGKIEIEELSTKILDLDLGAGKVNIVNLNVLNNAEIEGGAGEVSIHNANLNNLDLDMGVGKFTLTGKLSGKTIINHGIGAIKLNLLGTKDEYQIYSDKGLGSVKIDGKTIKDDEIVGTGNNKIDVDGGIGSIDIDFIDQN